MEQKKNDDFSSPITFPCEFIIKIMGKASADFELKMLNLIQKHYPETTKENIKKRSSQENNYIALTVTVHAKSQQELDALYQDISKCPSVLMAL